MSDPVTAFHRVAIRKGYFLFEVYKKHSYVSLLYKKNKNEYLMLNHIDLINEYCDETYFESKFDRYKLNGKEKLEKWRESVGGTKYLIQRVRGR